MGRGDQINSGRSHITPQMTPHDPLGDPERTRGRHQMTPWIAAWMNPNDPLEDPK